VRLHDIYDQYKDAVNFLIIYTREAHPDDGWRVQDNLDAQIHYKEPTTDDERTEVAAVCQTKLDYRIPMLIDRIDNDVEEKYIAAPMRLFLVDKDGTLVYTGDQGPRGWDADTWEQAIKAQLA
jgi:hypothetical protein